MFRLIGRVLLAFPKIIYLSILPCSRCPFISVGRAQVRSLSRGECLRVALQAWPAGMRPIVGLFYGRVWPKLRLASARTGARRSPRFGRRRLSVAAGPVLALWLDAAGWRCPFKTGHAVGANAPLAALPIRRRVVTLAALKDVYGAELMLDCGNSGSASGRASRPWRARQRK